MVGMGRPDGAKLPRAPRPPAAMGRGIGGAIVACACAADDCDRYAARPGWGEVA